MALPALLGRFGWAPTLWFGGLALLFYLLPYSKPRERETVQVDDEGVTVQLRKSRESVLWSQLKEVRIVTTDVGPFAEDVFFLLEGLDGKGCAVPHDAAVRTKLLEEIQARLRGVDDRKVIEAMGTTSNATFIIWRRP